MRTLRRFALLGMVTALGAMACAGEDSAGLLALLAPRGAVTCSDYLAAVETSMSFAATLGTPGATTPVEFEMFIPFAQPPGPVLLTREIVITLPATFGFLGFDALGASAQIGQWDFDYTNPGNGAFDPLGNGGAFDYRIPHYAIDANAAYGDARLNAAYDAGVDTVATHTLGTGGAHVLTLVLPSGGTNGGGNGNCSYFDTDVRFTLPAGIVTLPAQAGSYPVTVRATSVDPDTGDADDQAGTPPVIYERAVPVTVPEPAASLGALASFAMLAAFRARRR